MSGSFRTRQLSGSHSERTERKEWTGASAQDNPLGTTLWVQPYQSRTVPDRVAHTSRQFCGQRNGQRRIKTRKHMANRKSLRRKSKNTKREAGQPNRNARRTLHGPKSASERPVCSYGRAKSTRLYCKGGGRRKNTHKRIQHRCMLKAPMPGAHNPHTTNTRPEDSMAATKCKYSPAPPSLQKFQILEESGKVHKCFAEHC